MGLEEGVVGNGSGRLCQVDKEGLMVSDRRGENGERDMREGSEK